MKRKISITIDEKILRGIDHTINGLIIRNRSQAIGHLVNKIITEKKTAVVMANGLVTRVTKRDRFRVLGKIKGEPVIETIIRKLRKYNFRNIFIVGEKGLNSEIFKLLGNGSLFGVEIEYVDEREATGDQERLKLLKGRIKNTFLVVPGENVFEINLSDLFNFHITHGGLVTLALSSHEYSFKTLSTVRLDGTRVVEFLEKPKKIKSHIASSGILVAEPELLEYPGKWLPYDIYPQLVDKSLLFGFMFSGYWFDLNNRKDFKQAKRFLEKRP